MPMITWDTDVNAPGCLGRIVADDGRTILIQTDWDYPGTASTFGWSVSCVQDNLDEDGNVEAELCDHSSTDGTVDCRKCGCKASQFIKSAGEWLADNDGATADDPGYFND